MAPILLTPEDTQRVKPYHLGMLSGHMIVYDTDGFFAAVLERLRRRLAELGSRRYVDKNGYEYWDLKPWSSPTGGGTASISTALIEECCERGIRLAMRRPLERRSSAAPFWL